MDTEFLSEEEIGARYPGEWVLVRNAEFDEQWRVMRGVVAAHSPEREEIARVHGELARSGEPLSVSVLCFKRSPENVALLFDLRRVAGEV
ncbi:hypothetical protein IAD21_04652 [Abditibacteriota bacterium]|nr:hypothetical protein IAD21_04652 [Abditibacteriota bacterium]